MGNILALALTIGPAFYLHDRWSKHDDVVRRAMIRDNRSDLLPHLVSPEERMRRRLILGGCLVAGVLVGTLLWSPH